MTSVNVTVVVAVSVTVSSTTGVDVLRYVVTGSIDRYALHQSLTSCVRFSRHAPGPGTTQLRYSSAFEHAVAEGAGLSELRPTATAGSSPALSSATDRMLFQVWWPQVNKRTDAAEAQHSRNWQMEPGELWVFCFFIHFEVVWG